MKKLAAAKHRTTTKCALLLVGLLGAFLLADLLWASSSSSTSANLPLRDSPTFLLPHLVQTNRTSPIKVCVY